MILGLDHVGLLTDDPAGVRPFLQALGLTAGEAGTVPAYGVSCEFWVFPGGDQQPAVELVQPLGVDSAVSDRLSRTGPGLYHIAVRVDDLEAEFARLRRRGFVAVDATPCRGARSGMRVQFMYLRKPAGLLVELVEYDLASG
jgi:methylmalonyl-CoA/ethylmalonyl-CoA epimerase